MNYPNNMQARVQAVARIMTYTKVIVAAVSVPAIRNVSNMVPVV